MLNNTYGYVRVSTRDQHEDRQIAAMLDFGVAVENITVEKLSGKDFQRPLYQQLVDSLGSGDVLVVKSIDRFGRNYDEIIQQWGLLTKEREIAIVVLDMPLLDTREGRDLTGKLIADIVLQVLSYVAQVERENIRQRQAEGIAAAKARGVKFGRRRIELPESFLELAELWQNGAVTASAASEALGISRRTFMNRIQELTLRRGNKRPHEWDKPAAAGDIPGCFLEKTLYPPG